MYILAKGTVTVCKYNEDLIENEHELFKGGSYFGEIALLL